MGVANINLDLSATIITKYCNIASTMESAKHKLTAFREACKPHSLYLRVKKCDLHLYMVTLWGCLAFVGLVS